jgi:hypothetical protein
LGKNLPHSLSIFHLPPFPYERCDGELGAIQSELTTHQRFKMPYIVMRHGIEHILNRPTLLPHYVDGYLLGAAAVLAEPLD